MMRMKTKTTGVLRAQAGGGAVGVGARAHEWEMRPGGMLVQKRTLDSDRSSGQAPVIRVRVKYMSVYHEISISPEATFGELKKMLAVPTGLHHEDQKLMYRDKERDSKAFLDVVGVKDRSKLVLVEDPIRQEKRLLEKRKNAKTEKASKAISEISLEVDRFAGQVSALEMVINKGGRVAEKDLINLTDLLMNQLLKLDGITADGDVRLQRKMQVTRVQKYVETLDILKIKNSTPSSNGKQVTAKKHRHKHPNGQKLAPIQEQPPWESNVSEPPRYSNGHKKTQIRGVGSLMDMPIHEQSLNYEQEGMAHEKAYEQKKNSESGPVVVTTKWETFDPTPVASSTNNQVPQKFNWEFFD